MDCSALAVLRADVDPSGSVLPGGGELTISFQSASSAAGVFTEFKSVTLSTGNAPDSPYGWPSQKRRVILTGFDAFVKIVWSAKSTWPGLALSLGVSG